MKLSCLKNCLHINNICYNNIIRIFKKRLGECYMTVIDFMQAKKEKEERKSKENQDFVIISSRLKEIFTNTGIPGFLHIDSIDNYIENELSEEFLDPSVEMNFNKSTLKSINLLRKELPNLINIIQDISSKAIEFYQEYKDSPSYRQKEIEEICNLGVELECKEFQFNHFLDAYDKRFK